MQDLQSWLERLLTWLFLPATVWGATGGLIFALHEKKNPKAAIVEIFGGIVTSNMLEPVIVDYCPEKWLITAFFLSGVGGMRLAMLFYHLAQKRLSNKMGGGE